MDDEERREPVLTDVIRAVGDHWPGSVETDDELDRALAFLGADFDGDRFRRACYAAGSSVAVVGLSIGLAGPGWTPVSLALLAVAAGVAYAGRPLVLLVARAKRTRALGAAPALVTRAVLSMELSPAPERAARFAADAGEGPLAESLDGHVRRAAAGPGTGLQSFATEWASWFPALERSCSLLESAAGTAADGRSDRLERARSVVLDATRDRMAEFAASVSGPATALYAFGVLLPLALVSLLPALRGAGVPVSVTAVAVVYDAVLPVSLLAASGWLLARRPVAFPPPAVDRSHDSIPDGQWRGPLAGLLVGVTVCWLLRLRLPTWTAWVGGPGAAVGTALVVHYRPVRRVHASVAAVEDGLADALALLGRRIDAGESVEAALPAVAEELPGATGDVLATAARRQRRLGVGVEAAFFGRDGALAAVPGERARAAGSLLVLAAREGRPAGETVAEMGAHLRELAAVEAEARRSVEQVTRTLSNTAAVFGPLVGGGTVALANVLGSAGPLAGGGSTGGLGVAVGGYVLLLAAVLTALSTGLARGFDRALVGYRVGLALLAATATYLVAFVGTGLAV